MSQIHEVTYFDVGDVIRVSNAENAARESAAELAEEDAAIERLRHEVEANAERVAEAEAEFEKLTPIQVRAIALSLS